MRSGIGVVALLLLVSCNLAGQGYLHRDGKQIVNGAGENVILKGVGTGNWMLMEGYMMKTSGFADTHTQFRNFVTGTIGEVRTDSFYNVWLANHCNRRDIDSMAAWGFNSVRGVMHYKWFTLPIEEEPVAGENTWLDKGFELVDSLLDWCSDNEIYLILDLHGAPGGQGKDAAISDYDPSKPSLWESKENRDKTVALWQKLAERYADEPWIGGYDLINETNWDFGGQGNTPLRNLFVEITDSIRSVDTNHIIFIEGNGFANDFSKLTPPWDDNMAYSFHKYATYNTPSVIKWVTDIRNIYNVPIWLGEAGENSNTWYANLVELCETENIGWSMWPLKKEGINNPLRVHVNQDYQTLINGWKYSNLSMTEEEAFQALLTFADNHRLENCFYHKDVVDALIRQPFSNETLPYTKNTVDSTIFAVDFDLGRNRFAYYDNDTGSYHYSGEDYTVWNHDWVYRNDGVDLETCNDNLLNNGFSVGWTANDEWMKYTIQNDSAASYTMEIRSASGASGSAIHLEVNGVDATGAVNLPGTAGWYSWKTSEINEVVLPEGKVEVKIVFDRAGSNLNWFRFKDPVADSLMSFKYLSSKTAELENKVFVSLNKSITAPAEITDLSDFSISASGTEIAIDEVKISEEDPRVLVITTSESFLYGQILKISYNGTAIMHENQMLEPFSLKVITNKMARHFNVPTRIQAESFYKNNGLALEDCNDTGGGRNTGYANVGDYLDYIIFVEEAGDYTMNFRVATERYNARLGIQSDSGEGFTTLKNVSFSRTGGWQTWVTQTTDIYLEQGKQMLRLLVTGEEHNLNWFEFKVPVGIEKKSLSGSVSIYPNPASDYTHIKIEGIQDGPANMSVMDLTGRVIIEHPVYEYLIPLDLTGYTHGIYFVRIEQEERETTMKLIVK